MNSRIITRDEIAGCGAFLGLLAAATLALLHPDAVDVYRAFQRTAAAQLHDSSGYLAHTLCYGTLAIAAVVLLPARFRHLALLGMLAHGVLTELSQRFIVGRTFDLADMACNTAAAVIVFTLASGVATAVTGNWPSLMRSAATAS